MGPKPAGNAVADTLDALRPEPMRYAGYRPCTTADGVTIYYRARGSGRPVVVINNLFQDPALWSRCGRLLTRDHRVVTFDLRNQGMSSPGPPGSEQHANDLIAVLAAVGAEQVALFGHSYGTRIALDCAIRFPELVEAVVLCGPVVHPSGAPRRARIMQSWRVALDEGGPDRLFDAIWPLISSDRMLGMLEEGAGAGYELLRASFSEAIDPDAVRANLDGALEDQRRPLDLGAVSCPVLMIAGEDDSMATRGALRELRNGLAGSLVQIVQGAAHLPYVDDPGAVVTATREFLARRAAPADSGDLD